MAATPLRLLLVEDSEDDAALVLLELRRAGFVPVAMRVETAEAMNAALRAGPWDLILADYNLPTFSGLAALDLYLESGLDIPFLSSPAPSAKNWPWRRCAPAPTITC